MYHVTLPRSALKDLEAIAEPYQSAIERRIGALAVQPLPHGVKKMKGYKNTWRIRVGDYRIIYTVDERQKIVDISGIGHRQSVYKP